MNYIENNNPAINNSIGIAAGIGGVFAGFLLGWLATDSGSSSAYCTFIAILLIIACRYGIRGCADMLVTHSELVRQHRADAEQLAKEEKKTALEQVKLMKENVKSQTVYPFTSEDFNENAQVMINKMVKEAKRNKTKVTGESMVTSVLSGIR